MYNNQYKKKYAYITSAIKNPWIMTMSTLPRIGELHIAGVLVSRLLSILYTLIRVTVDPKGARGPRLCLISSVLVIIHNRH